MTPIRIATRASRLALWQAEFVRAALKSQNPDRHVELVEIVSTGDQVRDRPLHEIGGVGLFTKEVQEAVLDRRADLAVHSLKDLPTVSHPDLVLAAVPGRGPVADVLLAPRWKRFESLPAGARVATSSLRRRAQLLAKRPDLFLVDIRGNVETRIRKLHETGLDGLVLASAGIHRLGLEAEITHELPTDLMVPAVGQGALGIECRRDDADTARALETLDDPVTRQAVSAERAFLHALQGGCQTPIGAYATVSGGMVNLLGIVLDRDGKESFSATAVGLADQPAEVGWELAQRLIERGADRLVR